MTRAEVREIGRQRLMEIRAEDQLRRAVAERERAKGTEDLEPKDLQVQNPPAPKD